MQALGAFGFPATGLTPEAIADRRRLLEMGVPPVQIHVMSAISGVDWDDVWADRCTGQLGSHVVPFIGRETYLRNKRRAVPKTWPISTLFEPDANNDRE